METASENDRTSGLAHPITPERRRLRRKLGLIAALDDAVDAADPDRLDELLSTYRRELPSDDDHLGAGYAAIARCLAHPGQESRAAAQAYYDAERASPLRRYVRRHCFER